MTDRLWAPWRMEFILGEKPSGCVLCSLADAEPSRESRVLARSEHAYVVLNKYPYAAGHLMVVPRRHTSDLGALEPEEHDDLWRLVRSSLPALARATNAEGINLGMNIGKAAGAGIAEHLHVHLVPRWVGDNNYVAVIGDLRVMPEHLDATWDRLSPAFDARTEGEGA